MMDLLPLPHDRFWCPNDVDVELQIDDFVLPGMIPFVRLHCPKCRRRYLAHLHVAFCGNSTMLIDEASGKIDYNGPHGWYALSVRDCLESRQRPSLAVATIGAGNAAGKDVILVNTLDPTYGHNLARMMAVPELRKQYPAAHIVVIVGRFFAWLVPDCADEVWIVEVQLRQCAAWNDTIATMTTVLCSQAKRVRYANIHSGPSVEISDFTRIQPFTAGTPEQVSPGRIAFHLREDRNWTYRGAPRDAQQSIPEQMQLIATLFDTLRKEDADIEFAVTGYGNSGRFPDWITDLRIAEHDTETERAWMRLYARSHLAMGIHGSHMILPSAHAMGAIQIPKTRQWETSLDTWEWVNRHRAQEALVRYLRLPISTSLSEIVSITFIHLRKMQQMAGYAAMGQLQTAAQRERFALQHHKIFKGGYPLECKDRLGRPL